jgi:hypothetical protein
MPLIKLMRDPGLAPEGFVLARQRDDGSFYTRDEANTILVDANRDWPGLALAFGGQFAAEQIEAAETWLLENVGTCTDDPGYF